MTACHVPIGKQMVAIVSQDPVLMSGSIEENITYGVSSRMLFTEGAARDAMRQRVLASATAANAHGFISELHACMRMKLLQYGMLCYNCP